MEIRVEEVKGFDTKEEIIIIEERIKETLNNHPFLEGLTKPGLVRVWVKMGPEEKTRINHRLFSEWYVVILYLWEENIRPHCPGGARGVYELDREKIDKVLYHEFGHFIDAKVNTEKFGYNDREYECQPYRNIYNILWCSYIDGRLKKRAPFSLKDRIEEGHDCIKINSVFIEKAWNKEFTTHKEFLYGAEEAYKESMKESDDKKANI